MLGPESRTPAPLSSVCAPSALEQEAQAGMDAH